MRKLFRIRYSWRWFDALAVLLIAVLVTGLLTRDALWTTCAAALATMIVIGVQSREIAHSTNVAEQAITISFASAIEAEKARLDQRVSDVVIRVSVADAGPVWPPVQKREWPQQPFQSVPPGTKFRLPGEQNAQFGLYVHGWIQTDDDAQYKVHLHRLCTPLQSVPGGGEQWSEPQQGWAQTISQSEKGGGARFVLHGTFSVAQWIENAQAQRDGKPLPHIATAEIVYSDAGDNGIYDIWNLQLTGSLIEPVAGETDSWQIRNVATASEAGVTAEVFPHVRIYWRSKRNRIELPAPSSTRGKER